MMEDSIKEKRKGISLTAVFMVIVCLFVVPVNIVAFYSSYRNAVSVRDNFLDACENEVTLFETQMESISSAVTSELSDAALSSWSLLRDTTTVYGIEEQQLIEQLRSIWQRTYGIEGGYLLLHDSGTVYITHNNEVINEKQKAMLVNAIESEDLGTYSLESVVVLMSDGTAYFFWSIHEDEYSYGVFMPVSSMFEAIEAQSYIESRFAIVDEAGSVLMSDLDDEEQETYTTFTSTPDGFSCTVYRYVLSSALNQVIPNSVHLLQVVGALSFLLLLAMVLLLNKLMLNPMRKLHGAMIEIRNGNTDYRIEGRQPIIREFRSMNNTFNHMVDEMQSLRISQYETEIEKLKVEAANVRLQVNPHMLLNSLNMLYNLAKLKQYDTLKIYTYKLSEYFRYALRVNVDLVPLEKEMQFVGNYMDIQRIRFPDSFTNVYDVDEELEDILIPPFLIQSFMENAVKYALKIGETIEIIIVVRREGDRAVISIVDTGVGMSKDILDKLNAGEVIEDRIGVHIGIQNTRKRLMLLYDDAELLINSSPGEGTQVLINLPIRREEKRT